MPASLEEAYKRQSTWNQNYYAGATRTNGARWNSLVNPKLNRGAHNGGVTLQGPNSLDRSTYQPVGSSNETKQLSQQQSFYDVERLAQQEYLNEIRQLHDSRLNKLTQNAHRAPKQTTQPVTTCMTHIYHLLACETCRQMLTSTIEKQSNQSVGNLLSKDNLIVVMLAGILLLLLFKGT